MYNININFNQVTDLFTAQTDCCKQIYNLKLTGDDAIQFEIDYWRQYFKQYPEHVAGAIELYNSLLADADFIKKLCGEEQYNERVKYLNKMIEFFKSL